MFTSYRKVHRFLLKRMTQTAFCCTRNDRAVCSCPPGAHSEAGKTPSVKYLKAPQAARIISEPSGRTRQPHTRAFVCGCRLSLEIMTLQPRCEDVETAEGVAITVTGVAQVRPDQTRLNEPLKLISLFRNANKKLEFDVL